MQTKFIQRHWLSSYALACCVAWVGTGSLDRGWELSSADSAAGYNGVADDRRP